MKKLVMLAMALVATLSASAQIEEGNWYLTPKIGVGIADLTGRLYTDQAEGTYDYTLRPITSVVAGLEGQYAFNDNLSIALGLMYSTQGAKTKDGAFKLALDYVNIPLTFQYYPIAECGLAFKAGVQVGFITRKKVTIDGVTFNADYSLVSYRNRWGNTSVDWVESEISKMFNKVDCSIPLAISYELYNFVLDVRYNLGLTNVMKDDPANSKNSVWQFTLGYKIPVSD